MGGSKKVGRPPAKRGLIEDALRQAILKGVYPPQSRLPTRLELSRRYDASLDTVQAALGRLTDDRFIVPRGAKGTFVAKGAPRSLPIALVVPEYPDTPGFARIWRAMAGVAAQLDPEATGGQPVRIEYGVDGHYYHPAMAALEEDVRRGRLGGLVFASNPFLLTGSPLLKQPGIPRVAFMDPSPEHPTVSKVWADRTSLYELALRLCKASRRRRIAFLEISGAMPDPAPPDLRPRGFEQRPYWRQVVDRSCPEAARNLVHLMMRLPPGDRPDALFVADDNLVEHASAGLIDAGVCVPDDILLVAHCNFPYPPPSAVPIVGVGFDARAVLRLCLDEIAHQQAGGAPRTRSIKATEEPDDGRPEPTEAINLESVAYAFL